MSSPRHPGGKAFMRQISPILRQVSPSVMSDSSFNEILRQVSPSVMSDSSYISWQSVLEQACKETLRDLARNAAQPDAGHGAQSIDCIVREASQRVLQQAVVCPLMHQGLGVQDSSAPPPKLLEDVCATPWVIWRENQKRQALPFSSSSQRSDDDEIAQVKLTRNNTFEMTQAEIDQVEGSDSTTSTAPGSACSAHDPGSPTVTCSVHDFGSPSIADGIVEVEAELRPQQVSQQMSCDSDNDSAHDTMQEKSQCLHHPQTNSKTFPRIQTDPTDLLCDLSGLSEHAASLDKNWSQPSVWPQMNNTSPNRINPKDAKRCSRQDNVPTVVRAGLALESATSTQLLMQWQRRPHSCLIVAKQNDKIVLANVQDMTAWLSSQGILVILEPQLLKDHPQLRQKLRGVRTFACSDRLEKSIDFVITVGGDGTLTWAVSLFKRAMPPVLAFAAGSLGFLTPFPLESWVRTLTNLLDLHCVRMPQRLVCRMRLHVSVMKRGSDTKFKEVQCLNEVLVHRGQSGSLVKLDVGVDEEKVTLVQGDGLILATPTGSTAYSLAAGGSMVHPSVPGILLTPVSPHSLSFRPALLPDSAVITISVPLTARCGAFITVDGKDLCALQIGDMIEVSMSPHPVPTLCNMNETKDWFSSVQDGLQWNERAEQKAA